MFDFHPAEVPLSTYSSTMCTNLQPILLFSGRFSRINLHILFIYLFCKVPLNKGSQDTRAGQGRKEGRRRGAPCGPLSAPSFVWGRLLSSPLLPSCTLPSSPPVPSPLSLPILAPSLSLPPPRSGEARVWFSERGGESPLGRVTKSFPQRGSGVARARESSTGSSAALDTKDPQHVPDHWAEGEEEKAKREKRKTEVSDDDDDDI